MQISLCPLMWDVVLLQLLMLRIVTQIGWGKREVIMSYLKSWMLFVLCTLRNFCVVIPRKIYLYFSDMTVFDDCREPLTKSYHFLPSCKSLVSMISRNFFIYKPLVFAPHSLWGPLFTCRIIFYLGNCVL